MRIRSIRGGGGSVKRNKKLGPGSGGVWKEARMQRRSPRGAERGNARQCIVVIIKW